MQIFLPRATDLGNFRVHRVLPLTGGAHLMVGPFIFWDQMGPGEFLTGQGLDVRPHPHIGLETVTYLFDGALDHRDSIGSFQTILPQDVNLMTAGRGIVHSERTPKDHRVAGEKLYGIQSWLVMPTNQEEDAPAFVHHASATLPAWSEKGVTCRLIIGEGFGMISPVKTRSHAVYMDIKMIKGARLSLPILAPELGIYLLLGRLSVAGTPFDPMRLLLLSSEKEVLLEAQEDSHLMVLGGACVEGPRYLWWNLVSSYKERFERAARDWKEGRFTLVPGDEDSYIPLPE